MKKHLTEITETLKTSGLSETYVKNQTYLGRRFLDHLEKQGTKNLKKVTTENLETYLTGLQNRKDQTKRCQPSTLAIHIRTIKRIFKHLYAKNMILINPAEKIKYPKQTAKLPGHILTSDEIKTILNTPDTSTYLGTRDQTIIEVFYSTGLRLSELTKLTLFDIDLHNGEIRINQGKGGKDRIVPLGKEAVKTLRNYITKTRPWLINVSQREKKKKERQTHHNEKRVFISIHGKPLGNSGVQQMIQKYKNQTGIKKQVSPHIIRHTFATDLVRNDADIRAVQEMLGHSDITTTQIYTKVACKELKRTHERHHPKEKKQEEIKPPEIKRVQNGRIEKGEPWKNS